MAKLQHMERQQGKIKPVLIVASVASMIDQFNIPNIRLLISLGYDVDVAANFISGSTCTSERLKELIELLDSLSVDCYQVDFDRKIKNPRAAARAFRQLDDVVAGRAVPVNKSRHHHIWGSVKYVFIHSHSPVGGAAGRLAAKRHGIRALYTAHGFHFYHGAPVKNWLLFYPAEWLLSWITDVLITINREDYERAGKGLHARKTVYVPGVGVDIAKFGKKQADTEKKREELGIAPDDVLLLSVGELISRKNHEAVIRALKKIKNPHVQYLIAGQGELEGRLKALARNCGLERQVHFLGFRTDISELCQAADIFVFPSRQEGLPLALMEAAASGLPVVCSNIRGNTDIVSDGRFLFDENSTDSVVRCLRPLIKSRETAKKLTAESVERNARVLQAFDLQAVSRRMRILYKKMENL